jgi:pimeloyl-ACP methyl ester carboxylesterase
VGGLPLQVSEHTGLIGDSEILWRQAAEPAGRGPSPILYVHGVPTDGDDWLPFLEQTGGFAPDLPGFGRSSKRGDLDFTMEGIGRFVEAFADDRGLDRLSLVMHDWGAAALLFAMRAPERIERLVLIDAVPLLPGYRWHRVARIWRRRVLGELFMGSTSPTALGALTPDLKPRARVIAKRLDQGTQRAILRLYRAADEDVLARAGEDLGRITCPSLVVWGDRDPYIPARFAHAYAEALGDATVRISAGAGHWPWLQDPELVGEVGRLLSR